jgi:putative oxidoreductase
MFSSESAFRQCYHAMTAWAREYLEPLALFFLRLVVAVPFWKSGLTKLDYFRNDQFDTLLYIFEDYRIPFLAPKVAAYLAMAGEIILPIALVLGLLGRFAAIGLLVMTAVIYYVDQNSHAPYWAAILFLLAVRGAGVLCVDAIWKFLITPKKN